MTRSTNPVSPSEKRAVLGGANLKHVSAVRLLEAFADLDTERSALLHELVTEAHAAEDAGDFVLWVQEKLAPWKKLPRVKAGAVRNVTPVAVEATPSRCPKCGEACSACEKQAGNAAESSGISWA